MSPAKASTSSAVAATSSRSPRGAQGHQHHRRHRLGSQAPAQAQNFRDSLKEAGMDTKICIGLRPSSKSSDEARACGCTEEDGTLGETFDVIAKSDLVMLLIPAARAKMYPRILAAMLTGATLGLSTASSSASWPQTARPSARTSTSSSSPPRDGPLGPKAVRAGQRRRRVRHQRVVRRAPRRHRQRHRHALGWSVALVPFTFATTLEMEYRPTSSAARILLGGVHGIVESLTAVREGWHVRGRVHTWSASPVPSYDHYQGHQGCYEAVSDKAEFMKAYSASYMPCKDISRVLRGGSVTNEIARGHGVRALTPAWAGHLRDVKVGRRSRRAVEEDIP